MVNFTKRANADEVLINLLKHFNISVEANTITNELNTHPDYPSLLAINDVAVNFGLNCGAYKISKSDLFEIPSPFVANTTKHSNEFMLVTAVTPETVTININNSSKKLSLKAFTDSFTGVILAADEVKLADKQYSVKSFFKTFSSAKHALAPVLLMFALVLGLVLHFYSLDTISLPYVFLLLFKSDGVIGRILPLVQRIE